MEPRNIFVLQEYCLAQFWYLAYFLSQNLLGGL